MSYRNDHEAALARVDALQHELAKLREHETAPPAPPRRPLRLVGVCMAALAVGVLGGVSFGLAADAPGHPKPAAGAPVDRAMLTWCADRIQATPPLDEARTDPRAPSPVTIEPIGRTGAPCRDELHTFGERPNLSVEERDALWQWVIREDELAGAISRIEVYYANDPYALDGYSTARQLWVEYDRAYDGRNRALIAWRSRFARG